MGSEFLRKQAAGFKKRLDKGLIDLCTADLFTQVPTQAPRVVAADLIDGHPRLKAGDSVVIQKKGPGLVALFGLNEVAALPTPPKEVLQFVETSFGCAKGVIEAVHEDASVLEISVC